MKEKLQFIREQIDLAMQGQANVADLAKAKFELDIMIMQEVFSE